MTCLYTACQVERCHNTEHSHISEEALSSPTKPRAIRQHHVDVAKVAIGIELVLINVMEWGGQHPDYRQWHVLHERC